MLERELECVVERAVRRVLAEFAAVLQPVPGPLVPAGVPSDLITTADAARATKRTPATIRTWVRRKRVKGYGRRPLLVSLAEVIRVLEAERAPPEQLSERDEVLARAEEILGRRKR